MNSKYSPAHYSLLRSTKSDAEVAFEIGVTAKTVWLWRKAFSIPNTGRHLLDYGIIDKLIEQGIPMKEIAAIAHCNPSTIYARRRNINTPAPADAAPLVPPADRLSVSIERRRKTLGLSKEKMEAWLHGLAGRQFMADGHFMGAR